MTRIVRVSIVMLLALAMSDAVSLAQQHRGNARSASRTSVHNKNTNVNRNVNRNTNIDVDRDVDRRGCCYHSGWGTAAAIATTAVVTAAVVGSVVNTLPPSCTLIVANGFTYQQCGTVWYQPQISGSSTTYIVVNAPR